MVQPKRPLGPNNGAPFRVLANSALEILDLTQQNTGYAGAAAYLRLYAQSPALTTDETSPQVKLFDQNDNELETIGGAFCYPQDSSDKVTVTTLFEGVVQGNLKVVVEVPGWGSDCVFWGDFSLRGGNDRDGVREIRPLSPELKPAAPFNYVPPNMTTLDQEATLHATSPDYLDEITLDVVNTLPSPNDNALLQVYFDQYPDALVQISGFRLAALKESRVRLFDCLPVRGAGKLMAKVHSVNYPGDPSQGRWIPTGHFSRTL